MPEAKPADEFVASPKRNAVLHAWITSLQRTKLEAEAKRRRLHPDELMAKIAAVVIDGDWFGTLLDNER